uniref:Uncharacterized protein n=1 Tax=Anopheles atroparvus TaxID=41427 RepID=A0AAG5DIV8_ANOAO
MSKSTAGPSYASKTQADIREMMTKIQDKVQNQRHNKPGPVNKQTPPVAVTQTSTKPIVQSATVQLQDNAFAKEIFIKHTNIADIVAEKLTERNEKTRQKNQLKLYQTYVKSPIMRICDPLHKLRFETRFWEGLFRMATTIPLREERDYRGLKHTLAEAGIKKLCFVDMSHDNILLKNQKYIISLLQSRFNNWSAKLRKLPAYLQDYQEQTEVKLKHDMKKLKQLIKAHGNMNWHQIAHMEDRMLCELLDPIDKRTLYLWRTFAFDDDNLNKKYHLGKYYRDPVGPMPVKTMFEQIPGPGPDLSVRNHASLSSAPAPSGSRASPFASPRRPISRDALAKPNELTFVPYDSSTLNHDGMRSWRRSHTQAQPVILLPSTSTTPNVTEDLSVAPDSIVSVMEIDHDSENIDTTNERTDQLVAKQSHIGCAEKSGSGNTGEQEPPAKRRHLQITQEEAMDAAADGTTSSSVVATRSTMGPPATRRCPTPPQITEDGAMDVGANSLVVAMQPTTETPANRTFPTPPQTTNEEAMDATANDSAASSVTCAQSGYSLDYVKFCTNIYSVMIKFRLEIHPKAPLTPLIIEKLVKKMYHFHQESFARSELPAGFRKLSANEQMALKTKGPFAWAWEQLHTPIGTERSEAPVISKSKTPVEKATTTDVQEITIANANAIERSRAGEQVQTPIGTERMESPVISKSKTPVEKATTPDVQEIATANANERSRAGEQVQTPIGTERSESPVISKSKTPVEKATTPDVQEITTASANERSRACEPLQTPIGTERSESPVISNSKTPVEKATAPGVQEITTANENERSRKTQPGRTVMQAKRQKKNCIFPGVRSTRPQNIVYESDTPPVTEPVFVGVDYNAAASQNQHIATNVDPLYEPDSTSFRPIVSSTHSQDGSIQPGQSDAPEKNVPSVSEPAIQNQQNTPTVDTLSEPDSLTFRPFVSSTQSQDGSSQPGQPDAPEENVPPVSEPNQNQQNTPTVDTLSEPDSLTFRPFVSSTQQQDTNSQQEQPVPMGENTPQALATTSRTPRAIPADDAANDSSCVIIKGERISQKLDTSGYAGYVEEIPCSPQIYTIVDSDDDYQEEFEAHRTDAVQNSLCGSFQQPADAIEVELNSMFSPMGATDTHDGQIQSFDSTVFP